MEAPLAKMKQSRSFMSPAEKARCDIQRMKSLPLNHIGVDFKGKVAERHRYGDIVVAGKKRKEEIKAKDFHSSIQPLRALD